MRNDQLKNCSELVDSGAISDEIFHDLQTTILSTSRTCRECVATVANKTH